MQDKTTRLEAASAETGLRINRKKLELMKMNTTANTPVTMTVDVKLKCLLTGVVLLSFVAFRGWGCSMTDHFTNGLLFFIGLCSLDIYWLGPTKTFNLRTLLISYIVYRLANLFMRPARSEFDKASRNVKSQQQKFLLEVLKQNSITKFSEDHGLKSINSVEEFLLTCPLTAYSNYKAYIDGIVENNSTDVLFPGKTDFFATTTGTTSGISKMFPKNTKLVEKYFNHAMLLLCSVLNQRSSTDKLVKLMVIRIGAMKSQTTLGIPKCPFSVRLSKHLPFYSSPSEVYDVTSERDCLYLHAVFGMADSGLGQISTVFSTVLLTFFKLVEKEWPNMCADIESGTLSNDLSIPDDLRDTLQKQLGNGNKVRANELRSEFKAGFHGILPRIWPQCSYVSCIETGHFKFAADFCRHQYLGRVPMTSVFHMGTEGFYGIRIDTVWEKPTVYTILGTCTFFEFVPSSDIDCPTPKTLLAHEVQLNEEYELVVTTPDGLYRYRTEDVVRITGFYNQFPIYTYIRRRGDYLNLQSERLPENLLSQVIERVSSDWQDMTLHEFVTAENRHVENITGDLSGKLFYVIFVEVHGGDSQFNTLQESKLIDGKLCELVHYYSTFRNKGTIQCLQLIQVNTGTFAAVKKELLSANPDSFIDQFKMPRIMRREKAASVDLIKPMMMDEPECILTVPAFAGLVVGLILINVAEVCFTYYFTRRRYSSMPKVNPRTKVYAVPDNQTKNLNLYLDMPTRNEGAWICPPKSGITATCV
ncbi:hypothetical protein ScPMuIL_007539 [Solemya velum]